MKLSTGQGVALLQGLWLPQSYHLEDMLILALMFLSAAFIARTHTSYNCLFKEFCFPIFTISPTCALHIDHAHLPINYAHTSPPPQVSLTCAEFCFVTQG